MQELLCPEEKREATLLFQVGTVLILPVFLGLDGVWLAIVAAELLALFVTIFFFFIKRKQYHYI